MDYSVAYSTCPIRERKETLILFPQSFKVWLLFHLSQIEYFHVSAAFISSVYAVTHIAANGGNIVDDCGRK